MNNYFIFVGYRAGQGGPANVEIRHYLPDNTILVEPLEKFLDEVNHSPDGFQWGYGGSGPAQLAYAILRRYFELEQEKEPRRLARELYQDFKRDIIAPNKGANLWITSHYITHWVSLKRGNNGRKTEVCTQF